MAQLERAIGAPVADVNEPATKRGQANDIEREEALRAGRRYWTSGCGAGCRSSCCKADSPGGCVLDSREANGNSNSGCWSLHNKERNPARRSELTPAEITAAGVQVAEVRTATLKTDIAAFGRVEQPESQLAAVSARIGGRVDKLYVQYTGERVRRGQPVADLYSPEVATAIEEYRLAEENRNQLQQSDDAFARDTGRRAGRGKPAQAGAVGDLQKNSTTRRQPAASRTSLSMPTAAGSVVDRKVTQGQYVNAGDTLLTVADLSQVWIKADVYEEQLPQIHQGQEVEITSESLPNQTLHGHVDFIEPAANPQTRTVPVHVHVANPGMRLLPGMFVSASFCQPRSAAVDRGSALGGAGYGHAQDRLSGPAQRRL